MTALPRLVCASANPHKVAEIALLLDALVDLLPRPDGPGRSAGGHGPGPPPVARRPP